MNGEDLDDHYLNAAAKVLCEDEHLFFTRYFFKVRQAQKLRVNWHHHYIADVLDSVMRGELGNVTIAVSPGGTKTELAVVNFMSRGLALNPWARFLHLTGSDTLASLNSSTARDIVMSDEFQSFWPMKIAEDAKAKKRWNVIVDGKVAGGVYATAIGGQVTGFRAGHMVDDFQGAIIIDDPIKPEDAFSRSKIDAANRKLLTTVKSRKANPKTPIILIMQRLAESDPIGFIQKGNLEGDWTHIRIPAVLDETYVKALPEKYQKLIQPSKTIDGRFSYWPYKEPIEQLLDMERGLGFDQRGQLISRHVFSSQYQQSPVTLGGNIIKGEHFTRYKWDCPPRIKWRKVFADTAQKTKERNDFSVFEEWGIGEDGKIYLLDLIRARWEAPELQRRAVAFWNKGKGRDVEKYGQLREMPVEDKSSGTGLIQTLRLPPYNIPIKPIEREKDKLTRVKDILAYIEIGAVCIPEDAPFTNDFVAECEAFTDDDSHDFDDQVDPLCDAINDMLQSGNKMRQWEALADKKEKKKE
jgi:predicted phage terminase large subunit-like protein